MTIYKKRGSAVNTPSPLKDYSHLLCFFQFWFFSRIRDILHKELLTTTEHVTYLGKQLVRFLDKVKINKRHLDILCILL